jgi:hypothetical protein
LKIDDNGVYGGEYRCMEISNFRNFTRKPALNGVKMEWKNLGKPLTGPTPAQGSRRLVELS